jgi:deoxyribodipyrimidine photo-lyase
MVKTKLNIVWIKRDLRTQDHLPFFMAEKEPLDYVIVYLFEPQFLTYPDSSLRHQQFVYHSLMQMNKVLAAYNRRVEVIYGNAKEVFAWWMTHYDIQQVFSYQESGIQATYTRDLQLAELFFNAGVVWNEYQNNGVVRGLKDRVGWDAQWFGHVKQALIHNQFRSSFEELLDHPFPLPKAYAKTLQVYPESLQ